MTQPAINPYLRTKVMTATPEELRLMLFDGAIRFARQARAAIDGQKIEESYHNLVRSQKIVLELSSSLKHSVDPELCGRLSALYTYIYRRLVDANISRDTGAIDEAIGLLEYERETWQMLMQKLAEEGGSPRAAQRPTPQPRPLAANPYGAAVATAGTYSGSA